MDYTMENNEPSQLSSVNRPKTQSSIAGASSNLVNSIVGAGIIGIPYAIREAGLLVGVILLILVAWLTDKSLRMIVELARFHPSLKGLNVWTYEDLMSIPFGRNGSRFVLVNMLIMAYGAMVAYLIIIKDTVPVALGLEPPINQDTDTSKDFWTREAVMLTTSLIICCPLSMMRDMASLSVTSLLSVTADTMLVGFVLGFSPVPSTVRDAGGFGQVLEDNWINGRLFIGLGVLSTAMACQHSAFIVAGSLLHPTSKRWQTVTNFSIGSATVLCLALGVAGYLGFLNDTQGDILNNFNAGSLVANAGRTLLAITMFFTYPMEAFVARHVLAQFLYNGNLENETTDANGNVTPEAKRCGGLWGRRQSLTFTIYLSTLIPALFLNDLGPVLSITGSLGASCIAYIGPGLVYLGLNGTDFVEYVRNSRASGDYRKNNAPTSEVELPVVGDAQATMTTSAAATGGGGEDLGGFDNLSKPWWYWLFGYPIWTAIASTGSLGTRQFLSTSDAAVAASINSSNGDEDGDTDAELIGPNKRDYFISMFMIVFGVIAAVVGVASNIYVQINEIFYTPT